MHTFTHIHTTFFCFPPRSWVIDKGIKKWGDDIRAYKNHLRKEMAKKLAQRNK